MRCAAVLVVAGACVTAPPPEPLPAPDVASFAAKVQPILDARCADPSCHGQPARPLAIYSATRYRADPARTFIPEPLTPDELAANAREVAAFALGAADADDTLVVRKPLAPAAGGCAHVGGVIYTSRDDGELRTLRAWLTPLCDGGP